MTLAGSLPPPQPQSRQWFQQVEYTKLRDEIAYLKQCQVRLIEVAVFLVGGLAALMGVRLGGSGTNTLGTVVGPFILLVLPAFAWLIIHKSMSAFRIIGWWAPQRGFIVRATPKFGWWPPQRGW